MSIESANDAIDRLTGLIIDLENVQIYFSTKKGLYLENTEMFNSYDELSHTVRQAIKAISLYRTSLEERRDYYYADTD